MFSPATKGISSVRSVRKFSTARTVKVHSRTGPGRWTEQAESAASVKRLIDRDRKEFLGNTEMMDKYKNEFGEDDERTTTPAPVQPSAAPAATTAAAAAPAPAPKAPAAVASPFASSTPSLPFGKAVSNPTSPFGAPIQKGSSKLEPSGLSPYMSPDPLNEEAKMTFQSIIAGINTVQVVLVLSFSTIIGLMLATFYVVNAVGGVRLAGLD